MFAEICPDNRSRLLSISEIDEARLNRIGLRGSADIPRDDSHALNRSVAEVARANCADLTKPSKGSTRANGSERLRSSVVLVGARSD